MGCVEFISIWDHLVAAWSTLELLAAAKVMLCFVHETFFCGTNMWLIIFFTHEALGDGGWAPPMVVVCDVWEDPSGGRAGRPHVRCVRR